MRRLLLVISLLLFVTGSHAQTRDSVVAAIIKEATENSQLESMAHALLDGIGPRLIGTPQMQQANDWVKATYSGWGIIARNEKWGTWRGWERGLSHIDMIKPRLKSLEGTQLAWSPATGAKAVIGEVILLPGTADTTVFRKWLPAVRGKFVLVSMNQPTGRPNENWEEFGTKESTERMKKSRETLTSERTDRFKSLGYDSRSLRLALEQAGAAGIVTSNWSKGFGVNKIFEAYTKKIPAVDISLEDYGLLYRLAGSGKPPTITVHTESKELGTVPASNTIAEIPGGEWRNEYVMLSAHLDSWDGAAGATDNGTGTLTMLEAMRILKKVYPHPRRTILAGHWSGEEQGLNGSRSFVEDHSEIINHVQVLFNQDNGTGRVTSINGQGFVHAQEYINRWLSGVPDSIRKPIETSFPGTPSGGGSDHASFVAAGVPAFFLSALSWSYGTYTWHTNRDTYDKIVFDDVRNNAMLTAILVYMACEDPAKTSREKSTLPVDTKTGLPGVWPVQKKAKRSEHE